MGVALFMFKSLTLMREKSSLNLRLMSLSRQKMALTRKSSIFAREFNDKRKWARQAYQAGLDAAQQSTDTQAAIDGSTNSYVNGLNCLNTNNGNRQQLQLDYQAAIDDIEAEQKAMEEEIAAEQLEIDEEQKLVQNQLEMISEELKSTEDAMKQAAKDGAPKYVA